jgi:microcystin-dependent protein
MTKGQVVYISGANGTHVLVSLSDADTEATSSKTLGFLDQDLANNADGYVITEGLLDNVDTAAATAGQSVWLSSTAGGYVFGAPPAEPAHSVYLGVVMRANANNGQIVVKVQNGYELNELHDVSAGSPSNGDLLVYNSTTTMWTKAAQSTLAIAQSQVTNLTTDLAAKAATTDTRFVPTGTIAMFGSGTAPTGWLLCNGQVTTGYTALAAIVGGTVPDLRNRFIVGAGSTYSQGGTGGATTHSHNLSMNGQARVRRSNNRVSIETAASTAWTPNNDVTGTGAAGTGGPFDSGAGLLGRTDDTVATGAFLPPYYALTYIIKT